MGKKHKHPEHENLERWLVSYADFITLLFATFVVLYALSQADLKKFQQVSAGIKAAFAPSKSIMENPGGVMQGTPQSSVLNDSGDSILDKVNPGEGQGGSEKSDAVQSVKETVEEINKEVQDLQKANGGKADAQEGVSLKMQERGIVISFASSLFFEPGTAGLKPHAAEVLNKIVQNLKTSQNVIHVEGHTDNQPIASAIYPSNWELSAARASSVVRFFVKTHGLNPNKLAAVGYADTRPVALNNTVAGRAKNRRVDIVILNTASAVKADAGAAQMTEKNVVLSEEFDPSSKSAPPSRKPVERPAAHVVPVKVSPTKPTQPNSSQASKVDIRPHIRPEDVTTSGTSSHKKAPYP